jgi:hypothetical protein
MFHLGNEKIFFVKGDFMMWGGKKMDWIIWNELKVMLQENVIMQIDNYTKKSKGKWH